jgi:hypothetical protein
MFVDWTGVDGVDGKGDIYIILKGGCGKGVQRIPVSAHNTQERSSASVTMDIGATERVTIDPPRQSIYNCYDREAFNTWQGADMSRDGSMIAMITQGSPPRVYFFPRQAGETIASSLSLPSCEYISPTSSGLRNEHKYEAVAFVDGNSRMLAETSECQSGTDCVVPLYFHELLYVDSIPPNDFRSPLILNDDGWNLIRYDNFEDGSYGNYVTAVNNVLNIYPTSTSYACEGNYALKIGGSNAQSTLYHSHDYDCTMYSFLRIHFQFQLDESFKHMSTLFLELSLNGGRGYFIASAWSKDVYGLSQANVCYDGSVDLYASDFGRNMRTFSSEVRLRFRTNARSNEGSVYIDAIRWEGHGGEC